MRSILFLAWLLAVTWTANGSERQKLPGHIGAAMTNLPPVGHLAPTDQLDLAIGLPLRNASGLTGLLKQLYDPASARFHQYLTPEQFTEAFGPSEQDYQRVIQFAKDNGLNVIGTHANRMLVQVRGS